MFKRKKIDNDCLIIWKLDIDIQLHTIVYLFNIILFMRLLKNKFFVRFPPVTVKLVILTHRDF